MNWFKKIIAQEYEGPEGEEWREDCFMCGQPILSEEDNAAHMHVKCFHKAKGQHRRERQEEELRSDPVNNSTFHGL